MGFFFWTTLAALALAIAAFYGWGKALAGWGKASKQVERALEQRDRAFQFAADLEATITVAQREAVERRIVNGHQLRSMR